MFTETILLIQVTQIIISKSAVQKIGRRAAAWRSSLWDSSESNSFVGLTDFPIIANICSGDLEHVSAQPR